MVPRRRRGDNGFRLTGERAFGVARLRRSYTRDGRLAGVLDFGSSGVGDPACDVVIAWTFLGDAARERFRAELEWDADTWARGRGWALWKALITLRGRLENGEPGVEELRAEIARILSR